MSEYTIIETKQFRGCGFMTVCKYNNTGDIIYIGDKDSKLITAIDTQDYNIIGTFEGHNGIIWSLDISKDDKILISASGDLTIGFFNAKDGTKIFQSTEKCIPKYVCTQKYNNNNQTNLVAIICEAITKKSQSYISIYDLDKLGSENFENTFIKLLWFKQSKLNVLTWLNDEELIIGCDDGKIIVRNINDLNGDNEKEYEIHTGSIKSIVWNKTRTQILTGSLDCTANQVDVMNGFKIVSTFKSSVPVNSACWNHNDRKVFLGGGIEAMNIAKTLNNDLNLKIYRAKDQKLICHLASHFGPIRYIDKAPNSKNFMSASQDGSVKIYFINGEETNEQSNDKQSNNDNDNEQKQNKIIFNKFGNTFETEKILLNETNKMFNLTWKPPKVKDQVVQKSIPGLNLPKNDNNDVFELNSTILDTDDKSEYYKVPEKSSSIRITNLPPDITNKELYELFDLYGRIEERGVKIIEYKESTMAFINYIYPESAIKAIDNMDGYVIGYCVINVELAKPK
jgi:translation initiation factor 3 subunit I